MLENIQIKTVSAWREKETASPAALTLKIESWIILYIRPSTPHFAPSPSPSPPHPERGHEADSQEVLAYITPANHHNHNLQQIYCSSSIVGYPRPGATCLLSQRKVESLSLLRCSVRACQNVTEWLAGYLVRCTVQCTLHCTLHCTLDTVSHCQPSLWYCSTNPSLTNMHPRWNLARSNMYGNSDI